MLQSTNDSRIHDMLPNVNNQGHHTHLGKNNAHMFN